MMRKHGESRAIALDISQSFDMVRHAALLNKLAAYGLPEKQRDWKSSFLSNRSIQVVVDGVPQGTILSPTLFLLQINHLLSSTENKIFGFADDCTLVSFFNSLRPITAMESHRQRCQKINHFNSDI
ncbi:hypothetical protein HHI36_024386 [Cryptolaemus montrouzieri]|uniref:Reverse transcriptase domain-containing protein n=1 Tax=Cryptolaemus montrouzieri TaxID=559131 RepID=A0ABD2N1A8_9CUCU